MGELENKMRRTRDADRTRQAILAAALAVFAEHGFDGARTDMIATVAGYNKSLIGQYFGDKLGLYTAVLKCADQELSELYKRLLLPLLTDETIATDAHQLRAFLKTLFGLFFDYMVENPQFTRIINWEQAEGWQTFAKVAAQFEPAELAQFESLFAKAQRAGFLRPDLDLIFVILLAQQLCWTSPGALSLYQPLFAARGLSSAMTHAHVRAQVVAFLVAAVWQEPQSSTE